MAHTYRRKVRNAPLFKLAMQLACVYQAENYVSFFRLIRQKATYLQVCFLIYHNDSYINCIIVLGLFVSHLL